jgi:hypothetical protein
MPTRFRLVSEGVPRGVRPGVWLPGRIDGFPAISPLRSTSRPLRGAISDVPWIAQELLGLSAEQMRGRTPLDARWRPIREDGSPWDADTLPTLAL